MCWLFLWFVRNVWIKLLFIVFIVVFLIGLWWIGCFYIIVVMCWLFVGVFYVVNCMLCDILLSIVCCMWLLVLMILFGMVFFVLGMYCDNGMYLVVIIEYCDVMLWFDGWIWCVEVFWMFLWMVVLNLRSGCWYLVYGLCVFIDKLCVVVCW